MNWQLSPEEWKRLSDKQRRAIKRMTQRAMEEARRNFQERWLNSQFHSTRNAQPPAKPQHNGRIEIVMLRPPKGVDPRWN